MARTAGRPDPAEGRRHARTLRRAAAARDDRRHHEASWPQLPIRRRSARPDPASCGGVARRSRATRADAGRLRAGQALARGMTFAAFRTEGVEDTRSAAAVVASLAR